jgi:hypothetical protein
VPLAGVSLLADSGAVVAQTEPAHAAVGRSPETAPALAA